MTLASSAQRALCLWLPHWPIQRLGSARPELKRRAFVLYEEYRRGCFRVVDAAEQARRKGVRPGMPLAEAASMTGMQTILHDAADDRQALLELAQWCEQFSPSVAVEEPDCLFLNITGLAALFGGELVLAEQVRRALRRQDYAIRLAVADTFAAAWAVSHFHAEPQVVVPAGQLSEVLSPLPITALRLPADVIETLAELGIGQIGQLEQLPRAGLIARFGHLLLDRLDQALGRLPETIEPYRPPPEITAVMELEYPVADRIALETILNQLLARITGSLSERQRGALQLECTFQCEAKQTVPMLVGLYQATANTRHLWELACTQLERLALPGAVQAVRLAVVCAAPLAMPQLELFEDQQTAEHRRAWSLQVDRLISRLGRESVLRAVLSPDAQAEFAFRYEPLGGRRSRSAKPARQPTGPGERPTFLQLQPLPLQVLGIAPQGRPSQFVWRGAEHRVSHAWGPERIEAGWWRGQHVKRDYYRVETSRGNRFWLFRRGDGQWFLHGVFD